MSFGRAARPTTPRQESPAGRPLSAASAAPAGSDAQPPSTDRSAPATTATAEEIRSSWHHALSGGTVSSPRPSKFSISTDAVALGALASARAAATRHPIDDAASNPLALDRRYSATHNQPFHSLKQVRAASWEAPLADRNLTLKRLALAGVERPDLARENEEHARAVDAQEAQRKAEANHALFLFREAQLGALHARKRERVELEVRSSLRPPVSESSPTSFIDAPQFQPLEVPPPPVDPWYSAHHLARDLTKHPWATDGTRAARAVRAIEQRAAVEAAQIREQREAKAARIRAVREREDRLRAANQARDALIASTFAHLERAPQNLDAHLSYLTSRRCAPRPPSAMPPNLEPVRLLPPHVHNKAAHIRHAGWTSLKTKITYRASNAPPGSAPHSIHASGASTARASATQSRHGSSRHGSRHEAFTARYAHPAAAAIVASPSSSTGMSLGSPRASAPPQAEGIPVAEGVAVWHPPSGARRAEQSGLSAFADSVALDAEGGAAAASQSGGLGLQTSAQFRKSFASVVQQEHGRTSSDALSDSQQQAFLTDLTAESARAFNASVSPRLPVRSQAWLGELELSPRSNCRLGLLIRPAHPPQASPRLENLAKPLARLQKVKEIGRDHRDFNGLLEQLPTEEEGQQGKRGKQQEEEKQQNPASVQHLQPQRPQSSSLSSRPSTARSRFIRESISVASPPLDSPRYASEFNAAPPHPLSQPQQQMHLQQQEQQEEQLQQPSQQPSAAPLPPRPGSRASVAPTVSRPASSCSTIALSARGSRLQHPSDQEHLPMWNRTNRLQQQMEARA